MGFIIFIAFIVVCLSVIGYIGWKVYKNDAVLVVFDETLNSLKNTTIINQEIASNSNMLLDLKNKNNVTNSENSLFFKDIRDQRVQDNLFINKQNISLQDDYNNKFALVNNILPTLVAKSNLDNITLGEVHINGKVQGQSASFTNLVANIGMDDIHVSDMGMFNILGADSLSVSQKIESPYVIFDQGTIDNLTSDNLSSTNFNTSNLAFTDGSFGNLHGSNMSSLDGYFQTLNTSNLSSIYGRFNNLNTNTMNYNIIKGTGILAKSLHSDSMSTKDIVTPHARIDNLSGNSINVDTLNSKTLNSTDILSKNIRASNMSTAPQGIFGKMYSDDLASASIWGRTLVSPWASLSNVDSSNIKTTHMSSVAAHMSNLYISSNINAPLGNFESISGNNSVFKSVQGDTSIFNSIVVNGNIVTPDLKVSRTLDGTDIKAKYINAPTVDFDNITAKVGLHILQKRMVDFGYNSSSIGSTVRSTDALDIMGAGGKVSIYDNLNIQSNINVGDSATVGGKLCVGNSGNCVDSTTFNKPSTLSKLKVMDQLCVGNTENCVDDVTFNKPSTLPNLKVVDQLCVGNTGNCVDDSTFNNPSELTNLTIFDKLCIGSTCVTEEQLKQLLGV